MIKKKRMRQEQRPWTCLSGVAVNPCESHFIKVVGGESHYKGFQRGRERWEAKEAVAGVNKQGTIPSQRKCHWSSPIAGHIIRVVSIKC